MNFVFEKVRWNLCELYIQKWLWSSVFKWGDSWILVRNKPSRGLLTKMWSENMLQIYRRTLMPNCDFNKVVISNYDRQSGALQLEICNESSLSDHSKKEETIFWLASSALNFFNNELHFVTFQLTFLQIIV